MTPDTLGPTQGHEQGQDQDGGTVPLHTVVTLITVDRDLAHPGHIQVHARGQDPDRIDHTQEAEVEVLAIQGPDQGHTDVHQGPGIVLAHTVIHHGIPIHLMRVPKSITEYAVVT